MIRGAKGRKGGRNLCAMSLGNKKWLLLRNKDRVLGNKVGLLASQRLMIRSAKTDDELTDRGYRDTFSSALRLLLDACQKFRAKNRSSLPFSSEMPL